MLIKKHFDDQLKIVGFEIPTLQELQEKVYIKIGEEKITANPEKDVDRTSAEGKASSVQFIHFVFSENQIKKFKDASNTVSIGIEHKLYNHFININELTKEALIKDFN